jgi:bifunctional DNA-binding transcriptional regulator/antitoxin component of YhaV-PrlF toxin-antitoxin module
MVFSSGEVPMNTVTLSSKRQVVNPKSVGKEIRLRVGQKVKVVLSDGRVEYVQIRPMRELRGSLRGMDTTVEREQEDRV